ncbi:MAG: carboxypeptidase-like regulatory domain-containing protein [Calditrichia bacterium]
MLMKQAGCAIKLSFHYSRRYGLAIGLVFALFYLNGCISEAPRKNPLDPALGIKLSGVVEKSADGNAIQQALIRVLPGETTAVSNENGEFRFDEVFNNGSYSVICTKDAFAPDTLELNLNASQNLSFALNELPLISDVSVTTRYEARFLPPNRTFLEFGVSGRDSDRPGSLVSAVVEVPGFSFLDSLIEVEPLNDQRFFNRFVASDFGINTLEALIGKPAFFWIQDAEGAKSAVIQGQLARIITQLPRPLEPSGLIGMPFDFHWEQRTLPFDFTYAIEIYLNVGINLPPVDTIEDIPSNQTLLSYNNPALNQQNYFWVLYIVDEFGNRSRSYETTLQIQ